MLSTDDLPYTTEIVFMVMNPIDGVLCRPSLTEEDVHCSDGLKQLMQNCWQEDPMARPSFSVIKTALHKIDKSL